MIRCYNSRFTLATSIANVNEFKRGVYNLKIQGQVCHITPRSVYPKKDDTQYCGQIYIYDDYKVMGERLKENKHLFQEHIKMISTIINNINPYAKKTTKNSFELTEDKSMPQYNLYFVRNIGLNKHCYDVPTTAGCAALIASKDGEIPASLSYVSIQKIFQKV